MQKKIKMEYIAKVLSSRKQKYLRKVLQKILSSTLEQILSKCAELLSTTAGQSVKLIELVVILV